MSNHIASLLQHWQGEKDQQQWVLATIFDTQGSAYRKIGAHMLINDLGQYFGLLSGGCLESDIMNQARRCWDSGLNRIIQYDMREEEDLAWQLGIGCGGLVKILLQPISATNQYLQLDQVKACLSRFQSCVYEQAITDDAPNNRCAPLAEAAAQKAQLLNPNSTPLLCQVISPPKHLLIVGGGVDARPVVRIAKQLGWRLTLLDPRSSYARKEHFSEVDQIIKTPLVSLLAQQQPAWGSTPDAIVIMSHNINIDAQALQLAQHSGAKYVGMLGPEHRTERVFERAELQRDAFGLAFANPIGLRLGGELPESIALSMLAEIHAFLEGHNGQSISGLLAP